MTPRGKINYAIATVAEHFHMTPELLLGRDERFSPLVRDVRNLAFWMAMRVSGVRSAAMEKATGRHRATLKNSYKRVTSLMRSSAWWRDMVLQLYDEIEIDTNPLYFLANTDPVDHLASIAERAQKERTAETLTVPTAHS